MTRHTMMLGALGEQRAAVHLAEQGMVLLDRNWRCAAGEIDIIARDGDAVVFVEVKTRRGIGFGVPAEAVVAAKIRRIRQVAAAWLGTTRSHAADVRFDVISILQRRSGAMRVDHIRAAF